MMSDENADDLRDDDLLSTEGDVDAKLKKLDKRLNDSQSFIQTLKEENSRMREQLSKAEGGLDALTKTRQDRREDEVVEEDELESFEKKLADKEFLDELDASPSKVAELFVKILKNQRAGIGSAFERVITGTRAIAERAADERLEGLTTRQQIEAVRPVIDKLRERPEYSALSDKVLLQIAKDTGKLAETDDDSSVSWPGSPSVRGAQQDGRAAPRAEVEEALAVGRQFHPRDDEKAKAYAKRVLASRGYKVK